MMLAIIERKKIRLVIMLSCCITILLLYQQGEYSNLWSTLTKDPMLRYKHLSNQSKAAMLCYMQSITQHERHNGISVALLQDILASKQKPTLDRSIFFIETSCSSMPTNIAYLTRRQACAVESAALHNPNSDIFVLYASPAYWSNDMVDNVMQAVLKYPNVKLRNLNLWNYAAGTPIQKWFEKGELFNSSYLVEDISNFLRFITLWRWGGTYLDLDVVVLRSLEVLLPNYVGIESINLTGSAIINFAHKGIGHEIAAYCLHDFQHKFDGQSWDNNGPRVVMRALKHFCGKAEIYKMLHRKYCKGFQVFPKYMFYAVPSGEWMRFFDPKHIKTVLNRIHNSYLVHLWNKFSKNLKSPADKPGAYAYLAAKNCPKVYAMTAEYF